MKPWTTWLARLGIAGACFLVTGCGGSDIPDASNDGQASTGSAPDAGAGVEERTRCRCSDRRTKDRSRGTGPRRGRRGDTCAESDSGTRNACGCAEACGRSGKVEHSRNAGHRDRTRQRLECRRGRFSHSVARRFRDARRTGPRGDAGWRHDVAGRDDGPGRDVAGRDVAGRDDGAGRNVAGRDDGRSHGRIRDGSWRRHGWFR